MVNFGPLAAEIVSLVLGAPGNFNGFRVLTALLFGTLVVGVSETAALNRGRYLYSSGRPSRWALAHIFSFIFMLLWPPCVADADIIFLPCGFFLSSIYLLSIFYLFFIPRLISAAAVWMSTIL